MAPLGPFGPAPRIAAGVSGGPHSLALALLAAEWARARGGDLLALVADHGLRPESGAEAAHVAWLLATQGIAARVLPLGLAPGPRMQERARMARLRALAAAAAADGRPWLLLGHHRGDQAETLLFRALRGSGAEGLAAMAPARAAGAVLLLRPLLDVPPATLEAVLASAGIAPVRDPSNADRRFARIRLREALDDPAGDGPRVAALAEAAGAFARRRARQEAALARRLAAAAEIRPEGFAWIAPAELGRDGLAVAALAALIRLIGGSGFAPSRGRVAAVLAAGGGTLGGAWLRAASGGRWLLARDPGMLGPPVEARPGAVWDGRFRLTGRGRAGWRIGPLGREAGRLRTRSALPAAVLAALPAVRDAKGVLAVVPALLYPVAEACPDFAMVLESGGAGGALPAWAFNAGQPDLCKVQGWAAGPTGTETMTT